MCHIGAFAGTIKIFSSETFKLVQEIQLGDEIIAKGGGGNKKDLIIFEIVEYVDSPSSIIDSSSSMSLVSFTSSCLSPCLLFSGSLSLLPSELLP